MKGKFFQTIGIAVILFLVVVFSYVNASQVRVIEVSPLTEQMLIFNLNNGQKFTGSLAISGGSGNDIDFWITDPQGTTIVNLGRVYQGKTFEFTAHQSGAYTFHFSNTFSLLSSKTVNLTYDVGLLTVGGVDWGILLTIIVVVAILLIVIVALAFTLYHRKSSSRTNQPLPPPNNPQQPSSID